LFPDSGRTILNENQRRLIHEIKLTEPGHYVLRARAKSDAIVARMSVQSALDYDTDGVAVRRAENMGGGHQTLSPDRELLLESFQKTSTISVQSRKTGEVWHLGNFPYLDHPEWAWHRDFGTMRGDLWPLPLFFFDTRHGSMWPIVSMNYHDYAH